MVRNPPEVRLVAAAQVCKTKQKSSQTDGFSPQTPVSLKLGRNFPLHTANGLHFNWPVIALRWLTIVLEMLFNHKPCDHQPSEHFYHYFKRNS